MTIYHADEHTTLYHGDVREVLRELPDASVDCVATSPPFYGLRDYGTGEWEGGDESCEHKRPRSRRDGAGRERPDLPDPPGSWAERDARVTIAFLECECGARRVDKQIGLEATPEQWADELVQVFRECRRVLKDSGTLWVECGDSYNANAPGGMNGGSLSKEGKQHRSNRGLAGKTQAVKPKDLLGTPWALAKAMQAPYYTGRIKDERDRIWLAAIIDGEGCIHIHKRSAGSNAHSTFEKADGTTSAYVRKTDTYGVMVGIANTNKAIIDRAHAIIGQGSFYTHEAGAGKQQRKQALHNLTLTGQQSRDLLREIYPHLVAKQHEARIAYHSPSSGDDAAACHEAIKALHKGQDTTVDKPAPPSLFEPGWYLRQCIVWGKPNAMPESVTDRCTSAHSYVFLFSKKPRYYFDAEAISEPAEWARWGDQTTPKYEGTDTASGWVKPKSKHELAALGGRMTNGQKERTDERRGFDNRLERVDGRKNPRSVWTIPTQGYPEAHFATWPEALCERIIKAGCPEGVCGACGKPRERLLETTYEPSNDGGKRGRVGDAFDRRGHHNEGVGDRARRIDKTLGWSDCGCGQPFQPGVILDPFGGSGTTAHVARKHGRRAILVELNEDYCELATRRIFKTENKPLESDLKPARDGTLNLFALDGQPDEVIT